MQGFKLKRLSRDLCGEYIPILTREQGLNHLPPQTVMMLAFSCHGHFWTLEISVSRLRRHHFSSRIRDPLGGGALLVQPMEGLLSGLLGK